MLNSFCFLHHQLHLVFTLIHGHSDAVRFSYLLKIRCCTFIKTFIQFMQFINITVCSVLFKIADKLYKATKLVETPESLAREQQSQLKINRPHFLRVIMLFPSFKTIY